MLLSEHIFYEGYADVGYITSECLYEIIDKNHTTPTLCKLYVQTKDTAKMRRKRTSE